MTTPIRLFVSSPSDVAAERLAVDRVARRVEGLFDGVKIEVYRWEKDHYYSAHTGFQEQIAEIGGFYLVVGVLWSRLGSPLPPGFAARMPPPRDGEGYPSGTAFELLEAIRLRRSRDTPPPDIFVYRKNAPANTAAADDDAAQARLQAELQAVNRFMADFFVNEHDGYKGAFKTVQTLDDFEAALQADLTAWLTEHDRIGRPRTWRIEERGAPFVGLKAFDAKHREVFFGRRPEIERARERLEFGQGFLLIDGASGTGKSSLARAGLLPRMMDLDPFLQVAITVPETQSPLFSLAQSLFAAGALPDMAQGDYANAGALAEHLLASGDAAPILRALDRAAHRLKTEECLDECPDVRLLVLVDQLEALFANRVSDHERITYAKLIEHLAASNRVMIVATLRANAREEALAIPALGRLINARQGLGLEPPGPDALGDIVRHPATAAAIAYERNAEGVGLDEVLLRETAQDPAALPLLQFALEQLYKSAANRVLNVGRKLGDVPVGEPVLTLTHADYHEIGGLSGAIGQQAEAALATLSDIAQARLPALVRALTEDSGSKMVLGRATMARAAPDAATQALVAVLVDARILVQGVATEGNGPPETVLRFSHERVLTAWARAESAAKAAVDYLRIRADLVRGCARWLEGGKRTDLLIPGGVRLAEAEKAFAEFGDELDRHDRRLREYGKSSVRRAQRGKTLALAASIVFLTVAVAAGWFGVVAREQSVEALHNQRNAMVTLALSLAETDPVNALKLVLASWPIVETSQFPVPAFAYEAISAALDNTRRHMVLRGHEGAVRSLAVSPDGRRIVSGSSDGTLRLWDAETGEALVDPMRGHQGEIFSVAFSPDGNRIASGGSDHTLRVWDPMTGEQIGSPLFGHNGGVYSVTFSPDGRHILSGGGDGNLRLWDASTHAPQGNPAVGHVGRVYCVSFSPDGSQIVSGGEDSSVRLWDALTLEASGGQIIRQEGLVLSVAFSPDGSRIVSGSSRELLQQWDSFTRLRLSAGEHEGRVWSVTFSFDGKYILSGGGRWLIKNMGCS